MPPRMKTEDQLWEMGKDALLKHARQRNIGADVRTRMTKAEIVGAILDRYDDITAQLEAGAGSESAPAREETGDDPGSKSDPSDQIVPDKQPTTDAEALEVRLRQPGVTSA